MSSIIGVDVGGTLLRAARFDPDLNMLERAEQPSRADLGREAVLERLFETIRQVLPETPEELDGIGLAIPGPLDVEQGLILASVNLPLGGVPIARLVRETIGGPVFIGNDADLAGLAEHQLGAGRGTRHMVYITVSTGIGGGLIIDGKPFVGGGLGGELGHMVILPDGPPCSCEGRGHLEALASGWAIAKTARERLESGERSLIREKVRGDLSQISARTVGEAAGEGDPLALEIITQAGRYVGMGIASLMSLLNPEMFVIGGGVTKTGDLLFEPMREAAREYAMHPRYYEDAPIVRAHLGPDVGLYGAAALVRVMLE